MSVDVSVPVLSSERQFDPGEIDFVVPWVRQGQYLFGTTTGGQLIRIDKDNLSTYNILTFSPHGTHYRSTDFTYWRGSIQSQDKIYVVFATDTQLIVTVVNPNPTPLVQGLDVITMVGGQGAASITNDGNFLYLVRDPDPSGDTIVHRFSLDGNFTHETLTLTGFARPKKILASGGFVYVSGFSVSTNFPDNIGLSWLVQINAGSFSIQASATFDRGGDPNVNLNDIAVSASDVWVRYTPGKIRSAPISNITSGTLVDVGFSSDCTGLAFDGSFVWALFANGQVISISPTIRRLTLTEGQNYLSNLASDGTSHFMVRYQTGTVVSSYRIPPAVTSGTTRWARAINGFNNVTVTQVATDSRGDVIVVGSLLAGFNSQIGTNGADFGNGPFPIAGGRAGFIAKYNPTGGLIWVRMLESSAGITSATCQVNGVAIDGDDNIITTGWLYTTVNFGGTSKTSTGFLDGFVAKYDRNNVLLWVQQFTAATNRGAWGQAVAVNSSGIVFVTGLFNGNTNFAGIPLTNSTGIYDVVLVRLEASTPGAATHANKYSSSGSDAASGIAVDPSGKVWVTGSVGGAIDLGGGTIGTSAGGIFIARYFGTDLSYDNLSKVFLNDRFSSPAIAIAPETGNAVLTGSFFGTQNFGSTDLTTPYNGGIFLVMFNSAGNVEWQNAYGRRNDAGVSVATLGTNLVMSGNASGTVDFGEGHFIFGGHFTVSFTVSGVSLPVYRWAKNAGSNGISVAVSASGTISVGTFSSGTMNFGDGVTAISRGFPDGVLIGYAS